MGFLLLLNQMIVPHPSLAKEERPRARESLLNGAEGKKEVSPCLEEAGVPGGELQSVGGGLNGLENVEGNAPAR